MWERHTFRQFNLASKFLTKFLQVVNFLFVLAHLTTNWDDGIGGHREASIIDELNRHLWLNQGGERKCPKSGGSLASYISAMVQRNKRDAVAKAEVVEGIVNHKGHWSRERVESNRFK
jgi:hypothetical protein